jgi:hypothetical protein
MKALFKPQPAFPENGFLAFKKWLSTVETPPNPVL